ncbi:hypothetical protein DB32_005312 [Sandaracinus amylolyticus]|uniref:Uncharacterized protein n=1 Tax=Sandaracinus amylolyticus TaxID=927083 RepID=A0A0F6YJS5_9BACT|nr:hypothetical protein DB32_005312 [Sandaracinus amylolyticus]
MRQRGETGDCDPTMPPSALTGASSRCEEASVSSDGCLFDSRRCTRPRWRVPPCGSMGHPSARTGASSHCDDPSVRSDGWIFGARRGVRQR